MTQGTSQIRLKLTPAAPSGVTSTESAYTVVYYAYMQKKMLPCTLWTDLTRLIFLCFIFFQQLDKEKETYGEA